MSDAKVIGERLISLRGERSRKEVLKHLNITYTALANYELGIRIPRDEIKVELAHFYGKTVEEIFFS